MSKPVIRKYSALAIRYTNIVTGEQEALYYIGRRWRLGGYKPSFGEDKFHWIDTSIKEVLENAIEKTGYSVSAVETWTGMPIHIVKSKLRLREWTSNKPVYGVPF